MSLQGFSILVGCDATPLEDRAALQEIARNTDSKTKQTQLMSKGLLLLQEATASRLEAIAISLEAVGKRFASIRQPLVDLVVLNLTNVQDESSGEESSCLRSG